MSERRHTPGPWALSERSSACVRTADQDQRIAYLETADNTFETCEANARLIAAAPDLLAAVDKVVNNWGDLHHKDLMQLRAAIAKVEVRS